MKLELKKLATNSYQQNDCPTTYECARTKSIFDLYSCARTSVFRNSSLLSMLGRQYLFDSSDTESFSDISSPISPSLSGISTSISSFSLSDVQSDWESPNSVESTTEVHEESFDKPSKLLVNSGRIQRKKLVNGVQDCIFNIFSLQIEIKEKKKINCVVNETQNSTIF